MEDLDLISSIKNQFIDHANYHKVLNNQCKINQMIDTFKKDLDKSKQNELNKILLKIISANRTEIDFILDFAISYLKLNKQ